MIVRRRVRLRLARGRQARSGARAILVVALLVFVGCGDDGPAEGGNVLASVEDDDAAQLCSTLGQVAAEEAEAQGSIELTAVIEAYRDLAHSAEELGAERFANQAANAADALESAIKDSDTLLVNGLRRDLARAHLDLACAEAGHPVQGS